MTIPAIAPSGWSGMFNRTGDLAGYSMLTTVQGGNRGRTEKWISHLLSRRMQMKPLVALMVALNGAAAGGAASATVARVDAQPTDPSNQTAFNSMGGLRPVSTVTLLSRVTTAADITYINQILQETFGPTYPTVLGSGGGGKLGGF